MNRSLHVIVALVSICLWCTPAIGQTARATGVVRDLDGKPIKGATIRAVNPDLSPREIVSTSDDKGRWAMLGLRIGTYTFVVDAPGFLPTQGSSGVRTAVTPPLVFALARDPGPPPGALPANIQAQIAAANMLREQGRIDQALNAYQEIRNKNSNLTSINFVIGATYRRKAALESDPVARRAALDRAIETYSDLLKADPENSRAKAELESARAEAAALPN